VLALFGTRPEAIKVAPVIGALQRSRTLEPRTAVTAQHRRLLDEVLELFGVDPAHDLDLMKTGQSPTDIAARALSGLAGVIKSERPSAVLVQGDTTTTMAAALAAFYQRVPVVHLEAGLRSHDLQSPFPEEGNRKVVTQLASLHLAPTWDNKRNLLREGVDPAAVVVTGNTVIDALRAVVAGGERRLSSPLDRLLRDPRRVLLLTMHRRESWGPIMERVAHAFADVARAEPDLLIVAPLHPNPVVRRAFEPVMAGIPNVLITDPLSYGPFCELILRSHLIITDSGGIQEEGPSLGKPVLVVRDTTERPEAIAAGTARLVGTDPDVVAAAVLELVRDPIAYASMAAATNPYGDGRAAERAEAAISHLLGMGARPEEFAPPNHQTVEELQPA
jgi:UDP-N-acetylglucosamine 2-epimerase (non-hydrolysing)